jgi:glutamate formiminotransferase/formiminotetrahydrofolate cyclodeaminase
MTVRDFTEETASESPAPGGGSIAAAVGAFGAALATMVANVSSHKRGWDKRWAEFSDWAERGKVHCTELLRLIDDDTAAFNRMMDAFALPKGSPDEAATRTAAIQAATRGAIEVPLRVMQVSLDSMAVIQTMAEIGLPASASDVGVAALCARAAVRGAQLNVRINCGGLSDKSYVAQVLARCADLEQQAEQREQEVLSLVHRSLY